jgi:hypothetical protein
MTTIPDFDIATDLKVEFFLPNISEGIFIIGISLIGSGDVLSTGGQFIIGDSLIGGVDLLGATAFSWQDLACSTALAQIEVGGSIQDQLYFQPSPAAASITLQTYEFDPSINTSFRPGVPVRVRIEKGAVDQVIWSGLVESIGGSYTIDGNNLLQIKAYDSMNRLMNTRIPEFDSENVDNFVSPYEQLELIAEQFGTSMHSSSVDNGGEIPSQLLVDVIPNILIYDAIQVGLGLFWLDPITSEFVFVPRPTDAGTIPEGTLVVGNDHTAPNHLCMTDIKTLSNGDVVFNSLRVELASDSGVYALVENQDSIDLYGKFAKDVTLNTTDEAELIRWSNSVFNQSPTNLVESVETLTKDREGTVTEAAFLLPGELIGVDFSQNILEINDYYTITKVSHYIDPDNWLTTLDLWKEA